MSKEYKIITVQDSKVVGLGLLSYGDLTPKEALDLSKQTGTWFFKSDQGTVTRIKTENWNPTPCRWKTSRLSQARRNRLANERVSENLEFLNFGRDLRMRMRLATY